jgi:hypothetical protein
VARSVLELFAISIQLCPTRGLSVQDCKRKPSMDSLVGFKRRVSDVTTSKRACDHPICLLAHELVNKVSVIVGHCDLLGDLVATDAGSARHLKVIRDRAMSMASVITSKAANGYHFKTGQRDWPSRTEDVLSCRLLWWQVGFGAPTPRAALEHVAVVQ